MFNALTDIPWMKTTDGDKTVVEVLKNIRSIDLDRTVPGYQYGSQMRFLASIFPLLVDIAGGNWKAIDEYHVEKLIHLLSGKTELFDDENPFMQLPLRLVKDTDKLKAAAEKKKPVSISPIYPTARTIFWNFDIFPESLTVVDATRLLVETHFYRSRNNVSIDGRLAQNAAPGLRYTASAPPAVEIIPIGMNLLETLALVTPTEFVTSYSKYPYWADRDAKITGIALSNLWRATWSGNCYYGLWDTNENGEPVLTGVEFGLSPDEWLPSPIFEFPKKDSVKPMHDRRAENDQFYFYYTPDNAKKDEKKMFYADLGKEPLYYIARWNAEKFSNILTAKISSNLLSDDGRICNFVFLAHSTGGSAQVFEIRYSKTIVGWRDEFLPNSNVPNIDEIYGSILSVRGKLLSLFREKPMGEESGVLHHLHSVQGDAESFFWDEIGVSFAFEISAGKVKASDAKRKAKIAAVKAINAVSYSRDTSRLEAHLKAENAIWKMKG